MREKKKKKASERSTLGLHLASRLLARLHHHRLCLFRFIRRYELVFTNAILVPLFGLVVNLRFVYSAAVLFGADASDEDEEVLFRR